MAFLRHQVILLRERGGAFDTFRLMHFKEVHLGFIELAFALIIFTNAESLILRWQLRNEVVLGQRRNRGGPPIGRRRRRTSRRGQTARLLRWLIRSGRSPEYRVAELDETTTS